MIYSPSGFWGTRKTNPKLIYFNNNTLYIIEKARKNILHDIYPISDIVCIETGNILLYSWITISGLYKDNWISSKIEYNAVSEHFFRDFIRLIRSKMFGIGTKAADKYGEQFDFLQKTDYKYSSYGRESILAGETLKNIAYQPERWRPFLSYFKRIAVSSHLTVLTDKEWIFLSEISGAGPKKYAIKKRYVPYSKITGVTEIDKKNKTENPTEPIEVLIRLLSGEEVRLCFSKDNINAAYIIRNGL